jgi:import inner membrane translocase subunit TIM21
MGVIKPQLVRASLARPSLLLHQQQLRNVAAFRNQKPGEASNDALGMVGTPKHRSRANDGTVPWSNLSAGEKVLRSGQQSFNFLVIIAGAALTIGIGTLLYSEVFSPSSKTVQFNHAVDRIRRSRECIDTLCGPMGRGKDISAYGETTWNKWNRNRPIASRTEMDRAGMEHLYMHFHAEGPKAKGTVQVHMVRPHGSNEWEYHVLALDVPGRQRVWVENKEKAGIDKKGRRMFGVKWW